MKGASSGMIVPALALAVALLAPHDAVGNDDAPAAIRIETGRQGCRVEIDSAPAGKTNAQGTLTISNVEPIEHYLHVRCGGAEEATYRVSPRAGSILSVRAEAVAESAAPTPLEAAEARIELRRLARQAVQERAAGQFDAAIRDLHQAAAMDPVNSDLHRELGITFLLEKDWKRARVEMLEALRRDPKDADAHNGLGYALDKMGDAQAALAEFRVATELDPDDPSYRKHYLEALAKRERQESSKRKR